jgi:mannitol-specific phosphotransferase system IIBC component
MEFLYFPEDKSEYIPGIISIIIIFILSILIVWLLMKASRKQVDSLNDQGYPMIYDRGETRNKPGQKDATQNPNTPQEPNEPNGPPTKKP